MHTAIIDNGIACLLLSTAKKPLGNLGGTGFNAQPPIIKQIKKQLLQKVE